MAFGEKMAGLDGFGRNWMRAAAVLTLALGTTACSSVPGWVDPTTWMGGSEPADTETTPGATPDLASLPARPAAPSTPDEQKQVSDSLAADGAQAKYSADALRGGTEAAAPPPPPPSATPPVTQTASDEPQSAAEAPTSAAADQAAPAAPDQPVSAAAPPPPPAPVATPMPAPSASAYSAPPMTSVSPSDAALGFKPSSAPPIDPNVAKFVSSSLVSQYQRTASAAGISSSAPAAAPAASYSGAATAVVSFPGDGTLLTADAKAKVKAAVDAFKAQGGQGYVRVVGHATGALSGAFDKSQDRANAVASEMIRDGVPANRVLVEALSDGQPSDPSAHRAEIFLQS